MKSAIGLAMVLVVALPAGLAAQGMRTSSGANDVGMKHTITMPDAVKWGPAPPFMPPGSQIAIMLGDPAKKGLFIIRGKMPDGYTIPPHWHSTIENVTVLSGTFNVGTGDKLDKSKGQPLTPGGFFSAPPRMSHFAWATGETVVEVTGMGPLDFKYVDPKDDPSNKAKTN
jgi:quercetin dioxygenase-like cupin family protein